LKAAIDGGANDVVLGLHQTAFWLKRPYNKIDALNIRKSASPPPILSVEFILAINSSLNPSNPRIALIDNIIYSLSSPAPVCVIIDFLS
jgi:hypothetical protein